MKDNRRVANELCKRDAKMNTGSDRSEFSHGLTITQLVSDNYRDSCYSISYYQMVLIQSYVASDKPLDTITSMTKLSQTADDD